MAWHTSHDKQSQRRENEGRKWGGMEEAREEERREMEEAAEEEKTKKEEQEEEENEKRQQGLELVEVEVGGDPMGEMDMLRTGWTDGEDKIGARTGKKERQE